MRMRLTAIAGLALLSGCTIYEPGAIVYGAPVAPAPQMTAPAGQNCREFRGSATIEGKQQQVTGVACQQPDGTWRSVQ